MNKKEEILKYHIFPLTDESDHGLCPPSTDYKVMCHELIDFFLGEDWYVTDPISDSQCMTEALIEIERRYWLVSNKKYRKKIKTFYKYRDIMSPKK